MGRPGWSHGGRGQESPRAGPQDLGYLGEKKLAIEQVGKLSQTLFHSGSSALRNTQVPVQRRLLVPREEDPLSVHLVVKEWDATAQKVTGEIGHLRHEVWKAEEAGIGLRSHVMGAA